jgi:hypothetical protein
MVGPLKQAATRRDSQAHEMGPSFFHRGPREFAAHAAKIRGHYSRIAHEDDRGLRRMKTGPGVDHSPRP